jgi:RND superfamily putative drug exporter
LEVAVFARLGTWCHDRRKLVLGLWVGALVLAFALSGAVGNAFRDDFNMPDVESKRGYDILDELFGGEGTGWVGTIVFRAEQGVDDPEVTSAMEALFAEVGELEDVTRVVSPYSEAGAQQISLSGEEAGKIAYANVELPDDIDQADAVEIRDEIAESLPRLDGVEIELGGVIFAEFEIPSSEALGLAFAIFILILAFGSVLAMGLPVGVALFGIFIGTSLATMLSHVISMPDMATFIGVMIGLGVGIDYALLIVTRYREQVQLGHTVAEATSIAIDTAGRSVLFAGTTVVISMLGMLVMGIKFIQGLGIGAAVVVAVTVAASLTLLPALLGFAGFRTELTRWRGLIGASVMALGLLASAFAGFAVMGVAVLALLLVLAAGFFYEPLRREVPRRAAKPRRETAAYRWSRLIQRRPWTATIVATVVLLILAIPTLGLRLGSADESNYDDDTSTKQAYDLMVAGFGKGFNGPLLLAAELPVDVDVDELGGITEAIDADQGVAFVSDPQPNDPSSPTAVIWQVIPTTGPQELATEQLVDRLRDEVLPPAEDAAGVETELTGNTAVNIDFSHHLGSRMPLFLGAVLLLSFLLLLLVFRSILVPIKAVIMNLLSIAASYGIVVALFQWGWLSDITGVQPAPIEPWAPMMLFAIVFGLSMDYEVFLLSRVREEWHRTGDSRRSVADGLAATAKVISAAAAIMVVVFGSFILEPERGVKMMGTGLAVAILLDATIVRLLLVPATMELLGDRNWWLPRWIDRILPTIDVEGHADSAFDDEEDAELQPV